MAAPTVSVLLTVYNGEPFLRESLESILNQTLEDFELVVVNDGSVDDTAAVLSSIDDERLRVFDQPNRGRSEALNRGLMHCRGEYIAVIDDDDLASPTRLERQVAELENRSEIDILGSWYDRRFEEDPATIERVEVPLDDYGIRTALPNYNPLAHSSVAYRSEAIEQVGGYDVSLDSCVDYDLWVRLAAAGFRFGAIDETLCTIRKHPNRSFEFAGRERINRWFTTWAIQRRAISVLDRSSMNHVRVTARNMKLLVGDIINELRR